VDKRKHYLIGLDTETCNGIMVDDKLDLSQSLVYDIGWAVTDRKGNIYETKSFVIYEIFVGMKDAMRSAYYAEKIPRYWEDIKNGQRKLVSFYTMRNELLNDMAKYNCNTVFAHNAGFDLRALNMTERYITKSKYRFFFPYNTIIWDTLKMSNDTIVKQKSYTKFCDNNDYKTKHKPPRNRATAEILYRYITGNNDFEESHTGLEDVLIETQILAHCFRQHKKMRKLLYD
jgi:hypothetical protein